MELTKTLAQIVTDDGLLKENKKRHMLYKSYANLFESDLLENLYLNSLELDEKYQTNDHTSWRGFLRHPSIDNFIKDYKTEIQEGLADQALNTVKKPGDALKMKEAISKQKDDDTNKNIVVFFIPQKDYTI